MFLKKEWSDFLKMPVVCRKGEKKMLFHFKEADRAGFILMIISCILLVASFIHAEYKPDFQEGFSLKLKDGTIFKGTGGTCAPEVADFNGDGKKDLLVGVAGISEQAKIHVLINVGTDASPEFETAPFLKDKSGSDITAVYD